MKVLKFKSFDESIAVMDSPKDSENKLFPSFGVPPHLEKADYLQEYLKSVIGRFVKADFLIGSDNITSKEGILKEVGTDYIVLEMVQSNDLLVCDLYSIKFVEII